MMPFTDPDVPGDTAPPPASTPYDYMGLIAPWLPQAIIDLWIVHYDQTGDADQAWEAVRQDPIYETYFPGNVRDDGSTRLDEEQYVATIEDYRLTLESVGINASLFEERFIDLIRFEVHPDEFQFRVDAINENILLAAPEVRQFYAENYGLDLTNEGILAAALDPEGVGVGLLTKQIGISQVAGEAGMRNLEVTSQLANRLYEYGIDTSQEAGELFGVAAGILPVLNTLAKRHDDPDDDFDLEEFVHAEVMNDPEQRRRMSRLIAQERASFRNMGGYGRDQRTGGISGLSPL